MSPEQWEQLKGRLKRRTPICPSLIAEVGNGCKVRHFHYYRAATTRGGLLVPKRAPCVATFHSNPKRCWYIVT